MNKKVIIAMHAVYTSDHTPLAGTGAGIERFLNSNNISYQAIKFPLVGNHPTTLQLFSNNRTKNIQRKFRFSFPISLITLQDFFYLLKVIRDIKNNNIIFIGINPVNAFYGIILKKMGRIKTVIFYTADYAVKRYENRILNSIYHFFDKFAIKNADIGFCFTK